MNDSIYLYPKTSCPCDTCFPKYPVTQDGIKSNRAVRGCEESPYFDCYNRVELKREIQPKNNEGMYDLNPQAYTDKLSEGFDGINCGDNCPPVAPTCNKVVYLSRDPRQFNSPRADYMPLDSIPIDGNVRLKDVYDDRYDDYGIGFQSYDKIKDGQIVYYIDKSIEDAFYKPVYSEPAEEVSVLYRDPMGSMKPEYNRNALVNTANPTVTTAKKYPYCLSYLQDTQSFREDIIALQQRKNNQEKWSARWSNSDI
jgi:hypothetical protein